MMPSKQSQQPLHGLRRQSLKELRKRKTRVIPESLSEDQPGITDNLSLSRPGSSLFLTTEAVDAIQTPSGTAPTRQPGSPEARSARHASLITYIGPEEPLPDTWYPSKIRRGSTGDKDNLERFWEIVYGLRVPEKRRASEPPMEYNLPERLETSSSHNMPTVVEHKGPELQSSSVDAARQRAWYRSVFNANLTWSPSLLLQRLDGRSDGPVTDLSMQPEPASNQLAEIEMQLQQRNAKAYNSRPSGKILSKAEPTPRTLHQRYSQSNPERSLLAKALDWLWFFMKWPVIVTFLVLYLLQIVALCYTVTSNAFLRTFCEMELPLIRDWVCTDYDKVLSYRQRERAPGATDFYKFLGPMLEDQQISTTLSLPHFLGTFQSEFRHLLVHLPAAQLSKYDEQDFRDKLTESIGLSRQTVDNVQTVLSRLHGTVEVVIAGSRRIARSLSLMIENSGASLQGPGTQSLDDPANSRLASSYQWLDACHLVYLPFGVEPFLEKSTTPIVDGIWRIRQFNQAVRQRLRRDHDGVLLVRDQLLQNIELSDYLGTKAITLIIEDKNAQLRKGHRRWYAFLRMIGDPDFKDSVTQQRVQALELMSPVYKSQTDYFERARVQLSYVLQALDDVEDALEYEESAVKMGMSPSRWILEQPKVWEQSGEKLGDELKVWDSRKRDYNQQIIDRLR